MKKVIVRYGDTTFLAKLFDVSEVSVRNALKFATNSDLSKRIRIAAITHGGTEVDLAPEKK